MIDYLRSLTDKQLTRLWYRIWEHIEKWYGTGSWDHPTLRVVYPDLYRWLRAISVETNRRIKP